MRTVVDVVPLPHHRLRLRFDDGEVREFDTTPYLDKGIFSELRDDAYFERVRVSLDTVAWPNGQDFDPDCLFLRGTPPTDEAR